MELNYTDLVNAIKEYTLSGDALSGDQFSEFLPQIIKLAEEKIIKELNLNVFDQTLMLETTMGVQALLKPEDYIGIRAMGFYLTDGTYTPLIRKDITWLDNYWRNPNRLSEPLYYASDTQITFKLAPTPISIYPIKLRYISRPSSISDQNPTTFLSTKCGDLLMWAAVVQAMKYLREDPQSEGGVSASYELEYNKTLELAKRELSNQIIKGSYY